MSQAPTTDADDVDGWCARHLLARWPSCCRWSRHQTAAAPGMCRGWSRHLGAPRHDWSRLCASQVYGRDSLQGVGEGQKRGGGSGCTSWALACAGAVFFRPWSQSPEHRRRTLTGGRSGLPTIGGGTGGGAECHAMPWMLQSRASWCPVQPLDFFISHHPLKS